MSLLEGCHSSVADGRIGGRLFATATDYPALLAAIKKRLGELNVSLECIDSIAGLSERYFGKLTCNPPIRYLSTFSMFLVLQALGLKIALVYDPEALQRVQSRLICRSPRYSKPRAPKPRKKRKPSRRVLARRAARQARWARVAAASISPG
jgi:hypothetical protein